MTAWTIGVTELRRMQRDRVNLFFLFIFPLVLILLIGAAFGGGFVPKLGVVDEDGGPLATEIVDQLTNDPAVEVEAPGDRSALLDDVERGVFEGGLVIPEGYTARLRSGEDVTIEFHSKPGDFSAAIRSAIDAAVGEQSARVRAALISAPQVGGDFDAAYEAARGARATFDGTEVVFTIAGEDAEARSLEDPFGPGAATQLILFTFVNSLAGSAALVQTRQYGVLRRMLSAPVSSTSILAGETLGRFFVAAVQGVFIVVAATVLFGVNWGDPFATAATLTLFALVSTGAAMMFGSILGNEQQAGALVPFGLALAALGGCMVPLEIFPDTMKTIAHVTPHAWANEAFQRITEEGAGVVDVLPQLGVLAAFAAALLAAGALALRRTLTT
ncbi:MAG TPA: ABC transporter permease [Actinomycetota bacterium]|jgi:ABC-2 type transport system permease protein